MRNLNISNIKFLDCTFRDGGYYCKWNFPLEIINQYFFAISSIGVEIVEIGYRSILQKEILGSCAYSTDEFLREIKNPFNLKIAVMVNAKELIEGDVQTNLQKLFPESPPDSPVSIVRIATSINNIKELKYCIFWLKNKGFDVCINITHANEIVKKDLISISNIVEKVDVIYFADSLGSIKTQYIKKIIKYGEKFFKGQIGFHAHNNTGLALANTMSAINFGATWVDSTVLGIGRGAGNANTELLAMEIGALRNKEYYFQDLQILIDDYFKKLKNQYNWGTNIFYYQSAKYGIHPTYVQKMISDKNFKINEIFSVLNYLKNIKSKSYNQNTLELAKNFYEGKLRGSWAPSTSFKDKEIIFIGPGYFLDSIKTEIQNFIKRKKLIVIALNAHLSINEELIDFRIASNPMRIIADIEKHLKLSQPLITPASMLNNEIKNKLINKDVLDFGLEVRKNKFKFFKNYAHIPCSKVIAYALSVIASGKASKLYLAGFDGFQDDDQRKNVVEDIFTLFKKYQKDIPIISITESRFNLPKQSIHYEI